MGGATSGTYSQAAAAASRFQYRTWHGFGLTRKEKNRHLLADGGGGNLI